MTLQKFLATLPSKIKIGPYSWKIVVTEEMVSSPDEEAVKPSYGETEYRTHTIRLTPKHVDAAHTMSTLWHEIYHAALNSFGHSHPRKEEDGAIAFETIISTVCQDNPQILDLMKKAYR